MGRRSNAAKAVSKIIKVQKQPGFFRVVIKNGDKEIGRASCRERV